jgi:hypothetical protein
MTGTPSPHTASVLSPILAIGLVAGTLDISDALIFVSRQGITPSMVFRFIASGLIGVSAAARGPLPVLLGVLLHYTIALAWTAAFVLASLRLPVLRRRPVISGLVYGVLVYLIMNLIVLPLSSVPPHQGPTPLAARVNGVLAVMLCIGLTVSLLTRWRFGSDTDATFTSSAVTGDHRVASQ